MSSERRKLSDLLVSSELDFANLNHALPTVVSICEVGRARLVVSPNEAGKFHAMLINDQQELLNIFGRPSADTSTSEQLQFAEPTTNGVAAGSDVSEYTVDVTVVETETGQQATVRGVRFALDARCSEVCRLESDAIKFKSSEVLIGARADVEVKNYFNPDLIQPGTVVHLGDMEVNIQTALTPPPTPQRQTEPESDPEPMDAATNDSSPSSSANRLPPHY